MGTTRVSSRGQVVLPASIRSEKGWGPGTELQVVAQEGGVFLHRRLRREELFPPITIEEFLARRQPYTGPPMSDADIEEALTKAIRKEWGVGDRD